MFDRLLHRYMRLPYTLNVYSVRKTRKPRATILLLHGMGTSGAAWDEVIKGLPRDLDIIALDLLGFGESPNPRWAVYSTVTQARSVIATLLKLRIRQQLVIVGHSLGGLVAVEVAKRYPLLVRALILCSPPFYNTTIEARRLLPNRERELQRAFRLIEQHPKEFASIVPLAVKYKLVEQAFEVTDENVDIYVAALRSSIVSQTSLDDAKRLRKPMRIVHGALDPVVIKKNLDEIVAANDQAQLTVILAGHAILGPYVPAVIKQVESVLAPDS